MNAGQEGSTPELAAFLASYHKLSDKDKGLALQNISQARVDTNDTLEEGYQHISSHSCRICQRLIIGDVTQPLREGIPPYSVLQGHATFTKKVLAQDIARDCILVQWIWSLLSRSTIKIKSELEQHGIHKPTGRNGALQRSSGDLDYISTESGLIVSLAVGYRRDVATLALRYELEPVLMDKLWEAQPDKHRYDNDYESFTGRYSEPHTASLRLFTPQGKC
jgi:hypothetical protein